MCRVFVCLLYKYTQTHTILPILPFFDIDIDIACTHAIAPHSK